MVEIQRTAQAACEAITGGQDALVYTSRELVIGLGRAGEPAIAKRVSQALVQVVRQMHAVPRFIIAKGGITASDLATEAINVQRAWVLGQILPGVPVWRLEAEGRFPGLSYVVFPGNVGTDDSLAQTIRILRGWHTQRPAGTSATRAGQRRSTR